MKINIACLLFLIPTSIFAQIKLEKRSLLNDKIELLVPVDFKPMTEEMQAFKYPNANQQNQLVLTDENAEVNITASLLNQPMQASQIGLYKGFMIKSLTKSHPDAQWMDNGIKPVNGKNVGYFKLMSQAIDQRVFVYYFFTNLDGKVLLLTFNCTEKLLPKWKDTAESIVSSLKIK